jgi:hypothetical protein
MLTRKQFIQVLGAAPMLAAGKPEFADEAFRVRISAEPDGVWMRGFNVRGIRENLVLEETAEGMLRSGTAILPEGGEWQFSRLSPRGKITGSGANIKISDVELGPESAPLAREKWELTCEGDTFTWKIEREFLRDVRIRADRFPAIVVRTQRRDGSQTRFLNIPGFRDAGMRLSGPGMFPLHARPTEYYEALSSKKEQDLQFSPSGVAVKSSFATGSFSYAKASADGTAPAVSFGAETVDPVRVAEPRHGGFRQTQIWTMRLESSVASSCTLDLPDRGLGELSRDFARVHNQWMGWMFGNNPASTPALEELAWFPMIQGLFEPGESSIELLNQQLLFFAKFALESDGFVLPRWNARGFYRAQWGNLSDQIPHFLLAIYEQTLNTGNRDFVSQAMPAMDRVAHYLLALDHDHDGVFEIPNASGLADGKHHCSNWYDIINFGHKDALINAYAVAALEGVAELKTFVGDQRGANEFKNAAHISRQAFNRVFWDEEHSLYRDWIDIEEKMPGSGRCYFYADLNLLSIIFGIADRRRTARILDHLDTRYQALCDQFHLKSDAIYATPANLYPVTRLGDLVDNGELLNQKVYPHYENGCSFFHSTGLEIAARGIAGRKQQAYEVFERVMQHGYARNRLWAAGLQWNTSALISEPLNNALLILWGFVAGCLGIRRTLSGVQTASDCPSALQEARHSFSHLGKRVSVRIVNGGAIVS